MEKRWVKMGTARIVREKCLAWELGKKCLICDEVCPFDAVELRRHPERSIAVPFIDENRCAGCGYCEHFCPVRATPAIIVGPMLALRLTGGSYQAAARERGYTLEPGGKSQRRSAGHIGPDRSGPIPLDENGLPPGFTE
jgi:ferredoxin